MSSARADGHEPPPMVYDAVGAGAGCAPLAVVSHGAGGSERGYRYLAVATIDSLLIGVHSGKMHFAGGGLG